MIGKITQKFLITCIIIEYFISLCSLQSTPPPPIINECSKWNTSGRNIIFGQINMTAGNDDNSLNLLNSNLDINRDTDAIAVLDDDNSRILVFNQSNSSVLFIIALDASNLTSTSAARVPSSIMAYDNSSSIYIVDGSKNQLMKINSPLEFGKNATFITNLTSFSNLLSNLTARGLCVDNTDGSVFISDHDNHQIIRYEHSTSNLSIYVGNGTAGNASNQLDNPTSIVMDNNRTLFVNDVGNNRIQTFKFNSKNGSPLPTNIGNCVGLSLYLPNILLMNTKTAVYLFNLTNNVTTCAIGCDNSELNDTHNALIDHEGNLIVTDLNVVLQYPIDQQCSDVTTQPTITTTIDFNFTLLTTQPTIRTTTVASSIFNPVNCPPGTLGTKCSANASICNMGEPCLKSGLCVENTTSEQGYSCECSWGYGGNNCENDQRPCQLFTCFQRGICTNTSLTNFTCQCNPGYEGQHCELTVNFCANATCHNQGVCFQAFLNYSCQCLSGFYGSHCEITSTSTIVRKYVAKSFGYVAILMLVGLIGFFVVMDVLKYVFGIDPAQSQRNALRKKYSKNLTKKKKVERPKVVYRFQYVN